jgi:diadenosine tetraphosphatase ApaH/serine/threonine PP2A family protein phosphatase
MDDLRFSVDALAIMSPYRCFCVFALVTASPCSADGVKNNVWGPVSNSVKMSIMVQDLSYRFAADDIADCSKFIDRLRHQSEEVSSFLWNRCSRGGPISTDELSAGGGKCTTG